MSSLSETKTPGSNSYSGPRDYRTQGRHEMYPELTHDEVERFNYLTHVTRYVNGRILPTVSQAYEKRVEPKFRKEHGRPPKDRQEIRRALLDEPMFQAYSALRRANMEQRQQAGLWASLRQNHELADKARALTDERNLELDSAFQVPRHITEVHHHCMPGSFYDEAFPGDVTNGANYDSGFFVTIGGAPDPWLTGNGEGMVRTIRAYDPTFSPKRILDVGCTIGHGTIPVAQAWPDAEVVAIDVGAPVLRYGAARARSMGVENIRFVQADGADLSKYEDNSFDLVYSIILFHETTFPVMQGILKECHRVLRPGGMMVHIDINRYTDAVPLHVQALRDWDAFYNNEPFWATFRELDVFDYFKAAGFKEETFFHSAPVYNHRADREGMPIVVTAGRIPPEASIKPDKHLMGARK